MKFYVLVIEGGIEPHLCGPYDDSEERDYVARARHEAAADDSAILALDVEGDKPTVRAYPSSFFSDEGEDTPGPAVYEYFINLDERGVFYADVRSERGETIFEIREPSGEGDLSFFGLGWMKHSLDLAGLLEFLVTYAFVQSDAKLVRGN